MRLLRPLAQIWTVLLGCTAMALALGLVARMLLPLAPWNDPPALISISPADGAAEVLPRSPITLSFSQPMNRQSALAALRITPATPGAYSWSVDARTLTFSPAPALSAAVTYTVQLDAQALGRWWRPLAGPRSVQFRTAPLPAVVAALPTGANTPRDSSIAIIFSQPIVAPEQLGQPVSLPQLQIEPPIAAELRWIDVHTLLVRPSAPLQAATRYTATLAPDLADVRGVALGQPFSWSFATEWPGVVERSPASDERWASPRQPLTLTLDAPLDPGLLARALTITPAAAGDLTASPIGSSQLITFTPRLGWQPGRSYTVTLTAPSGSGLGQPPDLGWRFNVEPRPGLLAVFPGQGQQLPPGQEVRLIFSTPMDEERLRAGLSVDPPVDELSLSVSGAEVRLRPALRPSSAYTFTLAAGTPDRSGEPIEAAVQVRVRTGPAAPTLSPPAAGRLITLPLSRTAALPLERVNLSALNLALYRLDTPTLLLARNLSPSEWRDFSPERYGQSLARQWRISLSDPPNTPQRDPLPIALNDGAPLDPGAYYLRAVAPEGPRLDLLLLVAPVRLAMRQSEGQVLIWATDSASGAPTPDLPVALYAGDVLLARGVTGADGVWVQPFQRDPRDPPFFALSEAGGPALVDAAWAGPEAAPPDGPRYRALLLLDQLAYVPGAVARLGGELRRRSAGGELVVPGAGVGCRLQLVAAGGDAPAAPLASDCQVQPDGAVAGTLRLAPQLAPGDYALRVQLGDLTRLLPLRVAAFEQAAELRIEPAGPRALTLDARRGDLPLAGATISWSLTLEPIGLADNAAGFSFGAPPAAPPPTSGTGRSDADGRLLVALPAAPLSTTLRYQLSAELSAPGDLHARNTYSGSIASASAQVGLRLPARVVTSDERADVELLALDSVGAPAAGQRIDLEVFRGPAPAGAPLLARRATSASDGRAVVRLVQLNPGLYTLIARAGDSSSSAPLWVAGSGYTGWDNLPGQVSVVADRAAYRVGDTARLLVTTPVRAASLLLSQERGELRGYGVYPLRAGQLVTLTITPEMVPAISLGAILADGEERWVGSGTFEVISDTASLNVSIAADQADYLPGATAAISISVSDAGGAALADLLLAVAPAEGGPSPEVATLTEFLPGQPPPLRVALLPGATAPATQVAAAPGAITSGYLVPVSGGAGGPGAAVAQATLPEHPGRWRISAYAFSGAARVAVASTIVTTSQPITLAPLGPPALRPGDSAEVALLVRNSGLITRTLQASLATDGAALVGGSPASQPLLLAPGGVQTLRWMIRAIRDLGQAELSFRVEGGGVAAQTRRSVAILPAPLPASIAGATLAGSGALTTPLVITPTGDLEVALAPGLRAALAGAAADLADGERRGVDEQAGLLLIAAQLARSGSVEERAGWREVAAQAWAELEAAQNRDGGWGWWPAAPSDPFVSAFALEAQTAARPILGAGEPLSLRALVYLERAGQNAAPELRAYIGYALARAGRPDPAASAALRGTDLSPEGLAFLALSLAPTEAEPSIERLINQASAGSGLPWQASGEAPMPRTPVIVSAAAAQALRALRPTAPALPAAERALALAWGVDGWAGAYATARVAAALLPPTAESTLLPQRVLLDGRPIASGPISASLRLRVPLAGLRSNSTLSVEAPPASSYLLAYRAPVDPVPVSLPQIMLATRYVDPESGTPLDPAALRLGQIVGVEVTVISARSLLRADLTLDLPAALELLPATIRPPFSYSIADPAGRRVQLGAAALPAGIYSLRLPARIVAAGSFGAPLARLTPHYDQAPAALAAGVPIQVTP